MGCNVHFYKSLPDKAHARKIGKKPKRTMKAEELTEHMQRSISADRRSCRCKGSLRSRARHSCETDPGHFCSGRSPSQHHGFTHSPEYFQGVN